MASNVFVFNVDPKGASLLCGCILVMSSVYKGNEQMKVRGAKLYDGVKKEAHVLCDLPRTALQAGENGISLNMNP